MSKVTLTADQVVGKKLYAKRRVSAYSLANKNSTLYTTYDPGQLIGTVYSWVVRGGKVWWVFEVNYQAGSVYQKLAYVEHNKKDFMQESLLNQFSEAEQRAIAEQSKIDLPNWLTFGGAGFAFYQSTQTNNGTHKLLWRLGGALAAAYGATKVIEKVDFNPFDDLLNTATGG